MDQMSLFDYVPQEADRSVSSNLKVVRAEFMEEQDADWRELFE